MDQVSAVGLAIAAIRRQQGVKLAGVSRYVAVSTLNAIEHGRIIPSISMLDAVTSGLELPEGHFDLLYLESVRDISQRRAIYARLRQHAAPPIAIQASLRRALRSPTVPTSQHANLWYLLAEISTDRGAFKRSAVILETLRTAHSSLRGDARVDVLSFLGQTCLRLGRPEDALGPLLEAVRLRSASHRWESALCNLALAWWKLGRYEQARRQWERAVELVTDTEFRANALMGLGNVELRTNHPTAAAQYFRHAQDAYAQGGGAIDAQARAVNNQLVACLRSHDAAAAHVAFRDAEALVDTVHSDLLRGELCETMAEWAAGQGDRTLATNLLVQAKDLLGTAPVVSWFSARFLELHLTEDRHRQLPAILEEMEAMITQLHDSHLIAAIRLRMILVAIAQRDLHAAETLVHACIPLFVPMGVPVKE